jgi:hypothetical protein
LPSASRHLTSLSANGTLTVGRHAGLKSCAAVCIRECDRDRHLAPQGEICCFSKTPDAMMLLSAVASRSLFTFSMQIRSNTVTRNNVECTIANVAARAIRR